MRPVAPRHPRERILHRCGQRRSPARLLAFRLAIYQPCYLARCRRRRNVLHQRYCDLHRQRVPVQEVQQFNEIRGDARGGHLRLVHDPGGQRQPVGAGQSLQRQRGVRRRNPFLVGSSAQQQRIRPHRPGGHLAQERRQLRQLFVAQQAGNPVGKAGHVFDVVPNQ